MKLHYKNIEIVVFPEFGLTINEINYKHINYISSYKNEEELKSYKGYKQAWMIPFCGRIAEGKFIYNGKTHQLKQNRTIENCAIHGLLYNKSFDFIGETDIENGKKYSFVHFYNIEDEGFPFVFETKINILLHENTLTFEIKVKNFSNVKMPLQVGWHPYFKLDNEISQTKIQLPSTIEIGLNEMKYPNGEVYAVHPLQQLQKIENKKLDNCFKIVDKSEKVYSSLIFNKNKLHLITNNSSNNYIQLYTPESRDCIALEPMSGEINCYVSGKGLIHLQANESYMYNFSIEFEINS
jgi:aldose 1-epimerase